MRLLFAVGFTIYCPFKFDHDWCGGVTQLAGMRKCQHKIRTDVVDRIYPQNWLQAVEANAVEQITGVATNCSGITYPQGGWLCPAELTRNVLNWRNSRVCRFIINISYRIYPVRMTVGC